jgi:tricorn protease
MDADGIRTESMLYTVPLDGGLPVPLPMPTAGAGDYSPDGRSVVYSPLFRDFRTWKRYQGGWAQDLFIFDLASKAVTPVAPSVRTERDPMWIGDAIYFVSDRTGTLNLHRYDIATRAVEPLTSSTTWDVRWASSDNRSRIVYELDGELEVYDVAARRSRRLAIHVPDDGIHKRPGRYPVAKFIEGFQLSPKGERALIVARGDIFTAPIEKGPTRNLTRTSNAHDKHARWSPDGRRIAFISDRSGEEQVWVVDQDGTGQPEQLTDRFKAMLYAPEWSGDGKRLAFSDKDGKVYVLTVADRKVVEIADDAYGRIFDYAWSADGGHLAFSQQEANGQRALWIWSVGDGKARRVTDGFFNAESPAWDPKGRYLYFLSERDFAPLISNIEWNFAGSRMTGVFALALRKDGPALLPPQSDEVTVGEAGKAADAESAGKGKDKEAGKAKGDKSAPAEPVRIDFEGLAGRVARLPIGPENINSLAVTAEYVVYSTTGDNYYGRSPNEKPKVLVFDLKKRESSTLVEDVSGGAISHDGSKLLVRSGDSFQLWDVKPKGAEKKTVSTAGLVVDRVPQEEWKQIFDEVWRRYRDFFYVRNLHGYDWKAIGDRYRTLLPHVAHRSDLTYVMSEMVAELNIGHAYIENGDQQIPERPKMGLPGARFELDAASGRYRIARILRGQNEEPKYRAPLTQVGVDVAEGDYVLAIDGVELKAPDNPYRLLRHKTDPVTLTVSRKASSDGARRVTYTPITSEADLLYLEQVEANRRKVAEATEGRVGYIHIPDMGAPGAYEFLKTYYPQIRKEGLVVDVRSNGGGNISPWIIERLDNRLLGTRFGYMSDFPSTYPAQTFHGHMACLINETSASDGDIFPDRFRRSALGPLIGKRTWGGVVGISNTGVLIDGGGVSVPQNATNDAEGRYIIEGEGVTPDIEVENDPASVIAGRDPQLERGIREILDAMAREPRKLPARPADPVKTK